MSPPGGASAWLLLAVLWGLWGLGHSLLLHPPLRAFLERAVGLPSSAYRLAYSSFAVLSILPPLALTRILGGLRHWWWPWPWWPLQALALAAALGLMAWAQLYFSRAGLDLTGLGQARGHTPDRHLLVRGGPYAHMRHPMYLAALLLLWARHLAEADLVTSLALTLYLAAGTWLEERRLRRQLGQAYRDYAARVPLLPGLPRPGPPRPGAPRP